MLSAMAYTILKLHKSEYEAVPCRALPLDTATAAVATRVCGLHRTLPLGWLPPNWMAYITEVVGCCGEESKADFSLGGIL